MISLENIGDKLPKHQVDDRLWSIIEAKLDMQDLPLHLLPLHKADDALFDSIYEGVQAKKTRKLNHWLQFYKVAAVAASVALLLFTTVLRPKTGVKQTQIVMSEEVIHHSLEVIEATASTDNIQQYCRISPEVCSSPEFSNLKSKWERLSAELVKLQQLSKQDQNGRLAHYMKRVEKDIFELERQMKLLF